MRWKAEAILDFGADDGQPQNKIVREYRDEYKRISEILDRRPEILEMVHRDLGQLSRSTSRRGRKADFTSENLFRAILVMQREGSTTERRRSGSPKVQRSNGFVACSRNPRSTTPCSTRPSAPCSPRPGK